VKALVEATLRVATPTFDESQVAMVLGRITIKTSCGHISLNGQLPRSKRPATFEGDVTATTPRTHVANKRFAACVQRSTFEVTYRDHLIPVLDCRAVKEHDRLHR
jgi:hypothetical protein